MTSLRGVPADVFTFFTCWYSSEISPYWPVESFEFYHYNSFLSKWLRNIYPRSAFKIACRKLAIDTNHNFHIQILRRTLWKTCHFFLYFLKLCYLLETKPQDISKISVILGKNKNSIIRSNKGFLRPPAALFSIRFFTHILKKWQSWLMFCLYR